MPSSRSTIAALKKEVAHLNKILEQSSLKDDANVIGIHTKEIGEAARKAGENIRQHVSELGDEALELRDTYADTVKSHPFSSTIMALAGGFVIGSLLRHH